MNIPKAATTIYLLQGYVVALAFALVMFPETDGPSWLVALVRATLGILVYAWMVRDAEQRNFDVSKFLASFSALSPELGVPIYLFKSRTIKASLIALVRITVFVLLAVTLAVASGMLMKRASTPPNMSLDSDASRRST